MFIVAAHERYLITGGLVSETVEEVSSEERAFDSKDKKRFTGLWWVERISSPWLFILRYNYKWVYLIENYKFVFLNKKSNYIT